ncbi:MAG: RNA ligase family protein [Myxococcota bacterium]
MPPILKYPRTRHIEGSKLQPGDDDLSQVRMAELIDKPLVIEEKLDGANSAVSFGADGELLLQSRGHYLVGGAREKHFAPLKTWAATHRRVLAAVLTDRYIMYGEWLYAKHTVFYDALPHWFLEFDCWDRKEEIFLSTDRRRALLEGAPVRSVPVIHRGPGKDVASLRRLIGPSLYKSPHWRERLRSAADDGGPRRRAGAPSDRSRRPKRRPVHQARSRGASPRALQVHSPDISSVRRGIG